MWTEKVEIDLIIFVSKFILETRWEICKEKVTEHAASTLLIIETRERW